MLGMLARCDKSGLGFQSRRLARLLKPDKIMLIDSTPFNGNQQHPEWYKDYPTIPINGFPSDSQVSDFLRGLDVVLTAESFYHNGFVKIARLTGVKTIQIINYEFWDNLRNPFLEVANLLIQPSHWMLEKMSLEHRAIYLPTPIFEDEFKNAREVNLKRTGKPRYLFLNGKTAAHDRNGLESLYEALQLAKGDFEIVIKAQNDIKRHPDPRITYDFSNPENPEDLYMDFDAMVLPRRYGGQCLPMCEALQSGLPVIMTDIDPNNKVLPSSWLVPSTKTGEFMTRIMIDIYSADTKHLTTLLDMGFTKEDKEIATELSKQYDAEILRPEYERIINEL